MKKLWLQSLIISVFVFILLWGVSKLTDLKLLNAFDPISQAMADFELTDYAFSNLRPDPLVDERIVLVNFGELPRGAVAHLVQKIASYKPRVIGIDALYNCEGGLRDTLNCPQLLDTLGNMMLSFAFQDAGNIVLGEKLMQTDSLSQFDTNDSDSLEVPDELFSQHAKLGYVTLPTNATYQEDVKISRTIWPKKQVGNKTELAFSTQIAMQYDSTKAMIYLNREVEEEIINFRGNIEVMQLRVHSLKSDETSTTNFATMFSVIDYEDVFAENHDPGLFKDKIVMIGFLGARLGDPTWEDKFFTPLNKKIGGRANPDMFGLVVHANVVAMILNGDFVNELAEWQKYLIAFIVCFLTVALFITIDTKLPIWFDAFSVIIQILQLLVISGFMVWAFAQFNFKLDLSIALGVAALVGPAYDIYKSIENQIIDYRENNSSS